MSFANSVNSIDNFSGAKKKDFLKIQNGFGEWKWYFQVK